MGTYRDQLLRETYGRDMGRLHTQPEEAPSGTLTVFKLKFTVCLFLFAGFVYLNLTGKSFLNMTADQIRAAVTSQELYEELSGIAEQVMESEK